MRKKPLQIQKRAKKLSGRLNNSMEEISPERVALARVYWEFKRRSRDYINNPFPRMDPDKSWEELHPTFQLRLLREIGSGVKCKRFSDRETRLEITIEFQKIANIKALKKVIAQQIDLFLFSNKEFLRADANKNQGQRDWDKVLLAGKLEGDGLPPEDIAKRIFPTNFKSKRSNAEEARESARTNAAELRAEFRRMIKGGYKEIVYP